MSTDARPSTSPPPPPTPLPPPALDTSALPDDPAVLKQMIVELLRALRQSRRDQEAVQQRLDALLRRLYGPRAEKIDPQQLLLFAAADAVPEPPPPPAEPPRPAQRGQTNQPHGRRRPARELRHEPRRYELTPAEQLCPACGHPRQEISVDTATQYDYKPAEVFVVEHQRVKYACRCCQGEVVSAPKPPQPLDRSLPGP